VLAGFMKVLGRPVVDRFAGRIVNTHPALLPSFPGAHAVPDALAYGVKVTGTTVHFVDEGVDTGPVIAQEAVEVRPGDDADSLHSRIKDVEHRLYVDAVGRLARAGWTVQGRTVVLP
jgi:phosphoribosylglycinamide formyltransferase-1